MATSRPTTMFSVDLDRKSLHKSIISKKSISCDDEPYVEVQNVRITPKRLILSNPFEGKKFEEDIVITNVGSAPAFVRILAPSSSAIRVKILKEGQILCSGMSIRRRLVYKVVMMTLVRSCIIPICINDIKTVNIHIEMETFDIPLSVLPSNLVDFGYVDAGPTPAKRKLTLSNSDVKPCKFTIDLGPNTMDLFVEPSHGIIMGGKSQDLEVSLMLLKEGCKSTEFWIIGTNPLYVQVRANIFRASLNALFTYKMRNFTFVKFPNTYYGIKSRQQLVIENNSQRQSFFCVLGEMELETMNLNEAKKISDEFKYFNVYPEDGKLLPNDVRVFNFEFAPLLNHNHEAIYYCAMLRIHKLYCKDLNPDDYENGIVFDTLRTSNPILDEIKPSQMDNKSLLSTEPLLSSEDDFNADSSGGKEQKKILSEMDLRVMLYGQFESPNVSVIPDEITLNDLIIGERIDRILQFQNNSPNLPIYCRFKKYPCVRVEPLLIKIEPNHKFEVTVSITPSSFKIVTTKITFDLLDYNYPSKEGSKLIPISKIKIPLVYRVAQCNANQTSLTKMDPHLPKGVDVTSRLATNFHFDKGNSPPNKAKLNAYIKENAYLVHPDDRYRKVKLNIPNQKVKSIYAGIPRNRSSINFYAISSEKRIQLNRNIDLANKAMKIKKSKPSFSCIDVTSEITLGALSMKSSSCNDFQAEHIIKEFIPLLPFQLNQIIISPLSAVIENIAFNSSFTYSLTIENKNEVALSIYLKPHKKEYYDFIEGDRFTIDAYHTEKIFFNIAVDNSPTNNCNLDIVVNNCYVFQTSTIIKACPKHLSLNTELLTFHANESNCKFVQLSNLLNVDMEYEWHAPAEFTVDPKRGKLCSGKVQACMISFEIGKAENMVYNLGIHTENKFYNLRVIAEGTTYKTTLPTSLPFGNLSLHILATRVLVLSSQCNRKISYEVDTSVLPNEISVSPNRGWLLPFGSVYLNVNIQPIVMSDSKCQLDVVIANSKHLYCDISYQTIYPNVSLLPEVVRFKKIAASSFDVACFTVKNNSEEALASIQFDVDRVPEFNYSEYTNTEYLKKSYKTILGPGASKEFSIHYYPFYPLVTSFPLPIVTNGISVNQSLVQMKGLLSQCTTRPTLKVYTQVLSYKLEVKSWKYSFKYFPYFDFKSVTKHSITIKNPMKVPLRFCIRLDELEEPFDFKPEQKSARNVLQYDCSIVCELAPNQSTVFEAIFLPEKSGIYSVKLPVFIKDDFSEDMHNYFQLNAEYPESTYSYDDEMIHLGFIPLGYTANRKVTIRMEYHSPDCDCEPFIDDPSTYLEIENTKPQGLSSNKRIQVIFSSSRTHLLHAKLKVSCSCPGNNIVIPVYGGMENNYLTLHLCIAYYFSPVDNNISHGDSARRKTVADLSCFTYSDTEKDDNVKHGFDHNLPYFEEPTGVVYDYMCNVIECLETWIYEQVFYGTKSYSIPDTIAIPEIKTYGEKLNKREISIKLPLILIFSNLAGPTLVNKFDMKYQERKSMSTWLRRLYKDIMSYLLRLGCFVNYIKPEYLLTYELYQDYMQTLDRDQQIHSETDFLSLAKQSWLDMLLQVYKVLVYKKATHNIYGGSPLTKKKSGASFTAADKILGFATENILSDQGIAILGWTDKHFQEKKVALQQLAGNKQLDFDLEIKRVSNFTEDLSDCLAFAALLLTYCPFFEKFMKDLYVPPKSKQQRFHNGYVVMDLFSKLQISFKITPTDLIQPNPVKMVMFLTYLCDFIIPLKVRECLKFEANLSKTKAECIIISNETSHQMKYNVIFFDNDDDLFTVDNTSLSLEAESHAQLRVTYWAKFLRVQKTVLYLCGEIPGNQYSTCKFYYLEGRCTLNKPSQTISVVSPVYRTISFREKLNSPYPCPTNYQLFLCKEDPANETNEPEMIRYESLYAAKTLSRIKFESPDLKANDDGLIVLKGSICSIVNRKSVRFMIARSTIGDFLFKFCIETRQSKRVMPLLLHMHKSLEEFPCTCHKKKADPRNSKCPRTGILKIPNRNCFLWSSVMNCFLLDRPLDEQPFWDEYKGTVIGSHIIQCVLSDHKKFITEDMTYFMKSKFNYNVLKQQDSVCMLDKLTIESDTGVKTDLPVHFRNAVDSFEFNLEEEDKNETRRYIVSVVYDL